MADDDDCPDEPHVHGFSMPMPAGLAEALSGAQGEQDRRHMAAEDFMNRIYDFLDSLSATQLLTLRKIFAVDNESTMCNFFEGMVVTVLRLSHKVSPETGKTYEEMLADTTTRP